jgi:hypothetical protein
MKNDFSKNAPESNTTGVVARLVGCAITLSLLSPVAVPQASASPELDRQFALTSLGVLRAWDNVDGLFGDLVTKAYEERLSRESRFIVQDLGKANDLLQSSKLPYSKLIEDPEVLGRLAKTLRLDSFIRTKAYKEGPRYRFVIDWVHAPKLQLLATETIEVEQPFRGEASLGSEEFRRALAEALGRLIDRVPFKGMVTGRDQTSVTLNLGAGSGVKKGDTVVLGTLDEVKSHPLLKTIVDWRLTPTGKVIVEEVDDGMVFARIEAEEHGRQILRFQKVIRVLPAPEGALVDKRSPDIEALEKSAAEPPRIGWLAPGILLGSGSRDTHRDSSSGFLYGMKADAQAWFTSDVFGEFNFAYGSASYSQSGVSPGAPVLDGVSLSMTQFRAAIGVFYHVTSNFFGPKGWVKVGFQNTAYGLPRNAAAFAGDVSFSSLFVGIGGDLPIRKDYGLLLNVDFGLFGSASEKSGAFGTSSGSNNVNLFAGGYLWVKPKMKFQLGIDFKSNSVDFVNGGSIANKVFAVSPSVLFYF